MSAPPAWQSWLLAQWEQATPGLGARLLQPLSWLYALVAAAHRGLYASGAMRRPPAPRTTLVVGNLVVGGAGKTPAVIALVRWLQARGHRPGVISRGYGRRGAALARVGRLSAALDVGDEPLLIHRRTGAPVVVGADRAAAAAMLCEQQPEVDLIVADDGLQHLRLARDIEVWVFDERGLGNGLLLPAGPLRGPLGARPEPRRLVLYTAGVASTPLAGFLGRRRLAGVVPLEAWWGDPPGLSRPLSALAGRRIWAAAGLARPEVFFAMLEAHGLTIERLPLPDHHPFDHLPWPADAADVVVTEKDAAKLRPERVGATRVWVATLDFAFDAAFAAALSRLLPSPPP